MFHTVLFVAACLVLIATIMLNKAEYINVDYKTLLVETSVCRPSLYAFNLNQKFFTSISKK